MDNSKNMRYQNDGLKFHAKKHEMVLTLNKTNISTTDQTPTPTRFIRNCEEIGLFQDLQNVNPFEETFRKAAENSKKGLLSVHESSYLSKVAGDDLHTPHLFPEVETDIGSIEETAEVVVRSEADTSFKTITPQPSPPTVESQNDKVDEPVQVILKLPSGNFVQLSTKPLQTVSITNPITVLPTIKPIQSTVILTPTPDIVNQKQIQPNPDVKSKLKAFLGGTTKPVNNPKPKVSPKSQPKESTSSQLKKNLSEGIGDDGSSNEKRAKILERNRIAAYRCRAKRKKWVDELVSRAEQMSNANKILVQEVTNLREEVARLKGLLLLHSNCPVTLAGTDRLNFTGVLAVRPKEKLTLNLEKAAENDIMDLDSPSSVVKKDEVLSSTAPPSTPDERIVTFHDLERENDMTEVSLDDKLSFSSSVGTTVIQINPNVLKTNHFS